MKRTKKEPRQTLTRVVENLRRQGYQPLFDRGALVEWRKVKGGTLHTVKVTVHDSGRATVHHRSTTDGKARHEPNRGKGAAA